MHIIRKDFRNGKVILKITDPDDLWYLSHIIDAGDFLKGTATRKVKIGESDNAKVVKKKITLTIEAEKLEYVPESHMLRINGTITQGPDDIPKGSYQNITLEVGSDITLSKVSWLQYHKERLDDATKTKFTYLFCLYDREEAMFAFSAKSGFKIVARIKSDLPKKAYSSNTQGTFYEQILKSIETYDQREKPQHIILAAPSFYKDNVISLIKEDEFKKKITVVSCSSVSKAGLEEVSKSSQLTKILQNSRTRLENILVEELFSEIGKEGAYAYGIKEVLNAIKLGAISKIFFTDKFITKLREKEKYDLLEEQLKIVDSLNGEVHIISSENEAGKKIDGIGGIAAILRYKTK
jgi:protein pelota